MLSDSIISVWYWGFMANISWQTTPRVIAKLEHNTVYL